MKQQNETYKGWRVKTLEHQFMKLRVAPELGGRIIQLEMQGYEFLFNNSLLEGVNPGETRLGECGSWLNFGGEKIWPAPQGWGDSAQWPGPPDPVLDSGIYDVSAVLDAEKGSGFLLTSPADKRTGIQIKRKVTLDKERTAVTVNASFINTSSRDVKWSLWPVVQMNTPGDGDDRYKVVCPVNPNSKFDQGYKVMHGLANSPQNQRDAYGNIVVNYRYLVGKIGLDSNAGWMAFLDNKKGKVLVLSFETDADGLYPEDTTIQVWTQGRGIIYSRNRIAEFVNNKSLNPPYLEMEILSPIKKIEPGCSIHFNYKMLCTTISPACESIFSANEVAVIACPLSYEMIGENTVVRAKYGVFIEGRVQVLLRINSGDNKHEDIVLFERDVSPFAATDLSFSIKSELLFAGGNSLLVMLYSNDFNLSGIIEQLKI